tara:strand:- start:637 stop:1029 length:393 start_codon:yes stop_codon:yes gene_type:complete
MTGAPDMIFAIVWMVRYAVMLIVLATGDMVTLAVVLGAFVPIEAVAVIRKSGQRDTLSELWTWVLRKLSKHERAFSGWNWLAVIFAALEAGVLSLLLDYFAPGMGSYADVMCVALAAMLHAHWLRPDLHG